MLQMVWRVDKSIVFEAMVNNDVKELRNRTKKDNYSPTSLNTR
jgi:hypothetical protein